MRDGWPGQLLQQAVLYDNFDFLQCLLEGEELANIDTLDACGRTAIYTAVSNNSLRCLRLLLENGGDANIAAGGRCHNMTPLHLAVLDCKHEAVKILLRFGASLVALDESGQTPMSLARVIGNTTAFMLLENEQERRNETLQNLSKRLCAACGKSDIPELKEALNECGINKEQVLNMIPEHDLPPLCRASQTGSMELVKLLLENGAAPVCQRGTGLSPIHIACQAGRLPVLELLLREYPDLAMARSVEHRLPLHIASAHPNPELLQCLLNHTYPDNLLQTFELKPSGHHYKAGFDINAQDFLGKMAIHIACENGMADNVQALLQYAIKYDRDDLSPEDPASLLKGVNPQGGNADACPRQSTRASDVQSRDSVLKRGGSTHTLRDSSQHSVHSLHSQDSSLGVDHTPSPLEERAGSVYLHPVVVNGVSNEGLTPLLYTIRSHCFLAASLLLSYGADPNQASMHTDVTMTPLAFAFEQHDLDIMKLLLESGVEDTDNRVLQGAFMSHDQDVVSLLLQFKMVKDAGHSLNKTEMWRLTKRGGNTGAPLERTKSAEAEMRPKSLATAVAVQWQGLGSLCNMDMTCLAESCRRLNPLLKGLDDDVALCSVTKIDISGNFFVTFPLALLTLPSLVVLNASKNKITVLPEEDDTLSISFMCPLLEELHLQDNKLTSLPVYVFRFPVLKFLDASFNKITELPSEMWGAPSLVTLDLTRNLVTKLPQFSRDWSTPRKVSLVKRTSCTSLLGVSSFSGRSDNRPPSVSASISSMEIEIPGMVFDVSSDSAEGSLLSPGNISEVTSNEVLHINKWSSTVKVVDKDPWKGSGLQVGLKQLRLAHNKFSIFPNCLACCASSLEVLNLSENPLECVGSISDLPPTLTELNLSRCGLKDLLPWRQAGLDAGKDLTCLGCGRGPPSSRYSALGDSPSSRASPLLAGRESYSSLALATTCPHRSHCSLPQLEKLNLSNNKLESVVLTRTTDGHSVSVDTQSISFGLESEEIQNRLLFPVLSDLDLSINFLHSLTSDIGEQADLKILSLRGNRNLHELPSKLGLLKKLWKLDLELCPLDGAIQDFLQNSRFPVRDILGFLLSVLEESTNYNCMNLMLVGCHKIGKTSLLNKLRKEGRAPTKPTHWRDRVSNEEVKERARIQTLSTVGIDINELIFDCGSRGTVNFRTWDFGGQREYYATHQYFLSPRSLYLVTWNIIDGERGVEGLQQWLVNIQARAPGAPVIIVGTHVDILRDKATRRNFPPDFEEAMVGMVRKLFINNQEPDKCGLPCILDTVNISCKTGENIRKLVDLIKNNVFELKHPRSRTVKLLGQKIPRKYLLLQTVVRELALERIHDFKEPVLNKSKYMLCVSDRMMEKGYTTFRDVEELEQATRFLHENGVLFHWDDLALRDLYFLDPQWLCDQLAKVVTVREINNFAQRGVMRIRNLEFLFRSTTFQPDDVHRYITSLLAKFEVALQFDEEHLLLPSLLPVRCHLSTPQQQAETKIPVRRPSATVEVSAASSRAPKRYESLNQHHPGYRLRASSGPEELHVGESVFYAGSQVALETPKPVAFTTPPPPTSNLMLLAVKPGSNPIFSFCRLYFMTYFPSGFWSRLIVRVLADTTLYDVVCRLFCLPQGLLEKSPEIRSLVERDPVWHCWQTGLELSYLGFEMLRVREVTLSMGAEPQQLCDYSQCRFKCSVEREWCYLDMANSRILEITFPTDVLRFHVSTRDGPQLQTLNVANTTMVAREEEATGKLLVKMVEHVDNLLQDWYPELGELRFHQNCEGRYLVTRVLPCPQCLAKEVSRQRASRKEDDSWYFVNPEAPDIYSPLILTTDIPGRASSTSLPAAGTEVPRNRSSTGSGNLTDGQAYIYNHENSGDSSEPVIFSYLVERCMLDVLQGVDTVCPVHGSISPQHLLDTSGVSHPHYVAPDVVFNDLPVEMRIANSDQLEVGSCLGEGNFGKVYEGRLYRKGGPPEAVALKVLFETGRVRRTTYLGFQTRLEAACSAYLTARQEVSILERLSHPHIVPFLGLALHPLSLVLGLAPNGALSSVLKTLSAASAHMPLFVVRQVLLQVAKALAYLHANSIIYRDLKSENVLVWDLPLSPEAPSDALVHVKIADYGISRTVLPSGAKGFGGTAPFIAPEILQHAGKGTYTDKVDIFSLGMFIFEIVTCRFPFVEMSNPNTLVCQGGRPSLTTQEVERCPTYLLDLLSVCWSQDPAERPSSASVVSMVASPQFCHLRDILTLGPAVGILCGVSVASAEILVDAEPAASSVTSSELCSQVRPPQIWLSSCTEGSNALEIFSFHSKNKSASDYRTVPLKEMCVAAMCVVDSTVWCVDCQGAICIYDIDTLTLTHQLHLPLKSSTTVLSLHMTSNQNVLVVAAMADCGVIYVCRPPHLGMVVSELVAEEFRVFRCYSSALVQAGDRCELWLGQGAGSVLVWDATTHTSADCLYHSVDKMPQSTCCMFLVEARPPRAGLTSPLVWSYNFPGTVVYCWSVEKRCILERLDCSAIYSTADAVPLGSAQYMEVGAQVTALNVIDNYLYIGNTRGRIVVAEALSMTPLCIFPAHSPRDFYVKCILPVQGGEDMVADRESARSQGVVTVGRGYVDLVASETIKKGGNATERERSQSGPTDGYSHHTFLLSWSAEEWEFY